MAKTNQRIRARIRRQAHVRKTTQGTEQRPRLSVFRSNAHIYAQVIVDGGMRDSARTLEAAASTEESVRALTGANKSAVAAAVGKLIAERCKAKGIESVVFDRNGFLYHGRVKALADGAREGGLKF